MNNWLTTGEPGEEVSRDGGKILDSKKHPPPDGCFLLLSAWDPYSLKMSPTTSR